MKNNSPLNRVILCCYGDSTNPDYWSNVPYLLGKAFEENGQFLVRVDLRPRFIQKIWNKLCLPLHQWLEPSSSYDFFRSFTNWLWVSFKLSCVCSQYRRRGTIVVVCHLSFAPWFSRIPVVLLGDWCYEKYIRYFLGRSPYFFENQTIKRDHTAFKRSDLVVSIFPGSSRYLHRLYPDVAFHYLGHVLNGHPDAPPYVADGFTSSALRTTKRSINLLFVGSNKYLSGVKLIINALAGTPAGRFHLHVIGLSADDVRPYRHSQLPVTFHGYLSKGHPQQRADYYATLDLADIIVNATPKWGPFSATVEAMSRHTAVITPPYDEFVEVFDSHLSFGSYLESLSEHAIVNAINDLSTDPVKLADAKIHAAAAVKDFRYSTFVRKLCDSIA